MSTTTSAPTPKSLFTELTKAFPDIDQLLQDLQTSESQLRELSTSSQVDTKLQLTLRLASIRLKLLFAKFADTAVIALTRILDSDKPETARRAACTLLQLAGLLGPKNNPQKPWEKSPAKNDITKQHLPTYSNSPTETLPAGNPTHEMMGSGKAVAYPLPENDPSTKTTRHPHPTTSAEFNPQNFILKNDITNIHGPTYRNLPHPKSAYHQALAAILPIPGT